MQYQYHHVIGIHLITLKEQRHCLPILISVAQVFQVVVCNPCQSSPSLTFPVPVWFNIITLCFIS